MYNLIKYCDNYSKTSGRLWKYYRDEWNDNLTVSELVMLIGNAPANGNIKDVEIMVSLKYISNFWRTLEMSLINCETKLILT